MIENLEEIISSMNPGDRMPTEKELSEQFNVGRSTIRESMKVFAARKILRRTNEGTFVADNVVDCLVEPLSLIVSMQISDINNLVELREILELSAIRIAARQAADEDILELEIAQWKMTEPGLLYEESQRRDIAFHNAIARATGNTMIVELLNALRTVIAKNVEDTKYKQELTKLERDYHQDMIEAIRAHDEERAVKCMQDYFESIHIAFNIDQKPRIKRDATCEEAFSHDNNLSNA